MGKTVEIKQKKTSFITTFDFFHLWDSDVPYGSKNLSSQKNTTYEYMIVGKSGYCFKHPLASDGINSSQLRLSSSKLQRSKPYRFE